jgi:hypothetical protein
MTDLSTMTAAELETLHAEARAELKARELEQADAMMRAAGSDALKARAVAAFDSFYEVWQPRAAALAIALAAAKKAERQAGAPAFVASFKVGDLVQVQTFRTWYPAEVVKVGRSLITVRYTTGTGVTRERATGPDRIRPAS